MKHMFSVSEVNSMVANGKRLIIAGDKSLLDQIIKGNWIGGTSTYFVTEERGITTSELLFVQEIPDYCEDIKIIQYNEQTVSNVYNDAYDNGFSVILIPYGGDILSSFALNVASYPLFASKPLIGWITGFPLETLSDKGAKVFDGKSQTSFFNNAIVLHVKLPKNKIADIDVYNVFDEGSGNEITFQNSGFSQQNVYVNNQLINFYEYIRSEKIDIKYPLVGKMSNGINTIVSFKELSEEKKMVYLYTPVFKDVTYKIAEADENYIDNLLSNMPLEKDKILLPYICILHYVYGELEGKINRKIPECPATFGEIARILLNQTLVCLKVYDK